MTFAAYIITVSRRTRQMRHWRQGQAAFNTLADERPDLADDIRGSDFDPYYDDSRLTEFYGLVCERWDS